MKQNTKSNANLPFSILKRLKSFQFAFQGLKTLWVEEHNVRIHVFAAILVIILGRYFQVSSLEWCMLMFAITIVLAVECMNTAIENIANHATQDFHPLIKKAKDLGAAAVLICAVGALIVGLVIFTPYLLQRF